VSGTRGLRRLVGSSAAYGVGGVLLRGLSFLLVPVYTRYLTPADYGIVAVTATVALMLGLIYPLGLHGALTRFYFGASSDAERRRIAGTLWVVTIVAAVLMALGLHVAGGRIFGALFPDVPFVPYIRLAVWTAFFGALALVPLNLLQAQQRARLYVAATVTAALLTTVLTVALVVGAGWGAHGYLLGGLLGAACAAAGYAVIAARSVTIDVRGDVVKRALAYSLPLVPHGVASWVLEMSDRAILARYVPLGDVGVYALGYQLGAALGLMVTAFTSAWVPFLFDTLTRKGSAGHAELSRMATYYAVGLCFAGLAIALLVRPALLVVTPPSFAGAERVTAWVAGAYVLNGLYVLPVALLFWKERTGLIPIVTVTAGLLNVGMNLLLVPRFGAIAAAWSTLAAYGVMLAVAEVVARRLYPFPYEFGRILRALGAAAALFAAGMALPTGSLGVEVAGRVALLFLYPVALLAVGFFEPAEIARAAVIARRVRVALR
jgi:O-antigen/teichoic acid export membrane protein